MLKATDQGDFYRVLLDARSLDYRNTSKRARRLPQPTEDFHSGNTAQMDFETTRALIATIPEMQVVMAGLK